MSTVSAETARFDVETYCRSRRRGMIFCQTSARIATPPPRESLGRGSGKLHVLLHPHPNRHCANT
jgi:hypothetical protein